MPARHGASCALNIEVRDSVTLASFPNVADRVLDDVVQIGWSIHGMYGVRFPLTEVADRA